MNVNTTLNISSNIVTGASDYLIQLSETPDFFVIAFEATGQNKTLAFSGLKYNTVYYNRVKTNLSDNFGPVRSFTTRTAESISYVSYPTNNASNVNVTLNITSNAVPGANFYTIQLSETEDFSTIAFERNGATKTLSFSGLKYNTHYFNRVKTNLSSSFGPVRSFYTKPDPALALRTVAGGRSQDENSMEDSEDGADQFDVEVYPNPFSEKLTLNVKAAFDDDYSIKLYDLTGKELQNLSANRHMPAYIDGQQLQSGVYILKVGDSVKQKIIRVVRK
jgi:hypothetical protein